MSRFCVACVAALRVAALGSSLGGAAVLLVPAVPARADSVQSEARSQTTSVVTAADGTTTTTITEKVTRDGRTTTSRRTVVSRPGDPEPPATPIPPTPPAVPPRPSANPERVAGASPSHRDGTALASEAVLAHNRERHKHGVGDLVWDARLAALADEWAHHLCRGGKSPPTLQHRRPVEGGPGENLWEAVTTEDTRYTIGDAVSGWAEEKKYYNERTGRCAGGTCGHYTQLVWKNTKQVGCAVATCPAGAFHATVWVCNYAPAGNFSGERAY